MIGMDRHTGAALSGVEHLRQSIADILTTPVGSRRMRPAYGCQLRRFVDMPITAGWKSAVQAEVAHALNLWEPRFKLKSVRVSAVLKGVISFELKGSNRWSEQTKRAAIESTFFIHAYKGTIGALRRVVGPLGYLLEVIE